MPSDQMAAVSKSRAKHLIDRLQKIQRAEIQILQELHGVEESPEKAPEDGVVLESGSASIPLLNFSHKVRRVASACANIFLDHSPSSFLHISDRNSSQSDQQLGQEPINVRSQAEPQTQAAPTSNTSMPTDWAAAWTNGLLLQRIHERRQGAESDPFPGNHERPCLRLL